MSINEDFKNWNPMEEDFNNPTFNSYSDPISRIAGDIDLLCLYVTNIPLSLTRDAFANIMSENSGRETTHVYLGKPKEHLNATFGFASYKHEKDAREMLMYVNRKPPLNLGVQYAKKKNEQKSTQERASPKFHTENSSDQKENFRTRSSTTVIDSSKYHQIPSISSKSDNVGVSHQSRVCLGRGQGRKDNAYGPYLKIDYDFRDGKRKTVELEHNTVPDLPTLRPIKCTCGRNASLSCSRCSLMPYCSQDCQMKDWSQHKLDCQSHDMSLVKPVTTANDANHDSSYNSEGSSCSEKDANNFHNHSRIDDICESKRPSPKSLLPHSVQYAAQNQNSASGSPFSKPHRKLENKASTDASNISFAILSSNKMEKVRVCYTISPSKFWVHSESADDILLQIEKELNSCKKKPDKCYVNNVYSVVHSSKAMRAKVITLKGSNYLVELLDYGRKEELSIKDIFELPQSAAKYPIQAISCILVDKSKEEVQWEENDIDFFKCYVSGKFFKCEVISSENKCYKVSLANEEGLHLFKVLKHQRMLGLNDIGNKSSVKSPPNTALSSHRDKNYPSYQNRSPTSTTVMKEAIKNMVLSVNTKCKVIISCIEETTSEIFVQLLDNLSNIESMRDELNTYGKTNTKMSSPPVKNEVVVCKYSADGGWYRAMVLERSKNQYKVFFLDYGNCDFVCNADIKPLPSRFIVPSFGVYVTLQNMKKEDVKFFGQKLLSEEWEMHVLDVAKSSVQVMLYQNGKSLSDLCQKNGFMKQSLNHCKLPSGEQCEVEICWMEPDKLFLHQVHDKKALADLNSQLNASVKIGLDSEPKVHRVYSALCSDGSWYRAYIQKELSVSQFNVNFFDYGNNEDVSIESLREVSNELMLKPVFCKQVIPANVEISSLKLNTAYFVEVCGEKSGCQLVKFLNISSFPKMSSFDKLELKSGINDIAFVHAENNIYYCQLKNESGRFSEMLSELQEIKCKPLSCQPSKGDVVCAKSNAYDLWYRALIITASEKEYEVFYIDYGNTEAVAHDSVMCLPEIMEKYPVFSISLKINNLNELGDQISLNQYYKVKATGASGNITIVNLVLESPMSHSNINAMEKLSLSRNSDTLVTLCCKENDVYYVHIAAFSEKIEDMESKLVNADAFEDLKVLPSIGDVICCKFSDGKWYRASVEDVLNHEQCCNVHFIDYGNSDKVKLTHMKKLPSELSTLPIFSIPVKFVDKQTACVAEKNGTVLVNVESVSHEGINIIEIAKPASSSDIEVEVRKLPNSPVKVCVSYVDTYEIYHVHLSSSRKELSQMQTALISENLQVVPHALAVGNVAVVKFTDLTYYRCRVKKNCGSMAELFFFDYGNTEKVSWNDVYHLPSHLHQTPSFSIPVKFDTKTNFICTDSEYTIQLLNESPQGFSLVKMCPSPIFISSLLNSSLDADFSDVVFLNFDGKFHFLTKSSDKKELADMELLLQYFDNTNLSHTPVINGVYLAKNNKKQWHRCCVNEVKQQACVVTFIDLGVTEEVPITSMCDLPEKLKDIPIFCIKALLNDSDLPERGITYKDKSYLVSITKSDNDIPVVKLVQRFFFESLECQSLHVGTAIEVSFCHEHNGTYFLQMVTDAESLNKVHLELQNCSQQQLLPYNPEDKELLCAYSSLYQTWYRGCIQNVLSDDTFEIHFVDYGSIETLKKSDLRGLSKKLASFPAFAIAVRLDKETDIELNSIHKILASNAPANGIQQVSLVLQQEETLASLKKPNVVSQKYRYGNCSTIEFESGDQDVTIYSIFNASTIYCAPFDRDNILANFKLIEDMNDYCRNSEPTYVDGNMPEEEEMVLALYMGDWYRACIIETIHPTYDVLYVDFGNREKVNISNIRQIKEEFMSLPIQGCVCKLTGFKVAENNETEVKHELQNFTYSGTTPNGIPATVRKSNDELIIEIPKITDHLVKKQIAVVP